MGSRSAGKQWGRGVLVIWAAFFLPLLLAARGNADVEVNFEAPALPLPLWHTNALVMKELALTSVQTFQEKEMETVSSTSRRRLSISGAVLSYERVEGQFGRATSNEGEGRERIPRDIGYDGSRFSTSFKLMWDVGQFSYGALIPYDHFDLDGYDANRLGALFFGQYRLPLSQLLTMGVTLNGTYIYNQIDSDIKNVEFDNFNTFGGNITVSLKMDTKDIYQVITVKKPRSRLLSFTGSIAFSYQFNKDYVEREAFENLRVITEVNEQHALMLGFNGGMRIGSQATLTLYGTWNYDATTYKGSLREVDTDYFDVILEVAWSLSPRFRFTAGYKKLLGHDDLESDQGFAGFMWRF